MILDINEEPIDLLAITACPVDSQVDGNCMLRDEGVRYNSTIRTCRDCWWKYLSKQSECFHE